MSKEIKPNPDALNRVRKPGTVRFAPYYRVQTFRPHIGAWSDEKGTFQSEAEAKERAKKYPQFRIREISMEGTRIL